MDSGIPSLRCETVLDVVQAKRPGDTRASKFFRIQARPADGQSGGPLVDAKGRLLGICSGAQGDHGYYCHLEEIHAFLRAEGLRASLVSQWRGQVYAAAREALSGEPGGQPARRIHISDSQWAELAEAGAAASPPMSPERLVRALCAWYTGRENRLPGKPAHAG